MGNQSEEAMGASPGAETTAAEVVLKYGGGSGNGSKNNNDDEEMGRRRRRKMRMPDLRVLPCMRAVVEEEEGGGFDVLESRPAAKENGGGVDVPQQQPSHLVITVNGLFGCADNWRYAAQQFMKKYPRDVIVHCCECNPPLLTFDGVDVMGNRVAEEVLLVKKRYPSVMKISFIGHSLGGLVIRYAVAKLYEQVPVNESLKANGVPQGEEAGKDASNQTFKDRVAGLEPVNFITSATPHLGSRGPKQVPMLCGIYPLERLAVRSSWFLGRTGRHLFLTDGGKGQHPLLLQMVHDTDDLKFMSALRSFKRRVAYANSKFDTLVGWGTSSLRRRHELPMQQLSKNEKYRYVVNVEPAKAVTPQPEVSTKRPVGRRKAFVLEEEMLNSLASLPWERTDVRFSGSKQCFFAHSTIQVNRNCINSDGADVIQHMIDNFVL
ncbi:hypothetical protein MLD38_002018 [Melastoma candidum]|uniref:Uncharacterized protein n=1 Tax=Melastoma candidum TaxID=119954 RepID=A0ACB9SK12_9MYRT|nr:hypothetical protein MLD38_002018 [Melastoma candidum]